MGLDATTVMPTLCVVFQIYRNATIFGVYFTFADFVSTYSIANKRS